MVLFAFDLGENLRHASMHHIVPPLTDQPIKGILLGALDLMHVVDAVLDELSQL
jgi:hypothetical protein